MKIRQNEETGERGRERERRREKERERERERKQNWKLLHGKVHLKN